MTSTLLALAALTLTSLPFSSAQPHVKRDVDGVLRLPVTATNASNILSNTKRQTVSPLENVQTGTRYMVEFSIGTPPQPISVALDTGSSETWVNPQCSTSGQTVLCSSFPRYSPALSTSTVDLGYGNSLGYGKGEAEIEYYTDDFLLGGASVTAQQFGVAYASSDIPTGLMGVGPGIELVGYPIIIDSLATQGITQSRAFSLDLRSVDSPAGAIIFGGIDTMKYTGLLEKCPIIPASLAPDGYDRYWIHMKSVGITKPGEASKTYAPSSSDPKGQPVFLDSGGTLSRLPTNLFNAIIADFPGATEDGNSGLYLVDCALTSQPGTVDFGFGNTIIHVPYHEFIWQIEGYCYVGVAASDDTPVLGDSFLRAAFVVYDQDNQNLLLANAANCGTNLVAITSGPDAVPSIVGGCGSVSSTSSSSSSTSTVSSTSSSSTTTSDIVSTTSTAESSTITSDITSTSSSTESSTSTTNVVSTTLSTETSTSTSDDSSSTISSSSSESATESSTYVATTSSSYTLVGTSASVTSLTSDLPSTTSAPYPLTNSTSIYGTGSSYMSGSSVVTTTSESSDSTTYTDSSAVTSSTDSTAVTSSTVISETSDLSTKGAEVTTTSIPVTEYSTSTVYATSVYTITSCAPTVTDCPSRIGKVTTEVISITTTLCPITPTPTPTVYSTSTIYKTSIYTITSCAPTVVDCPARIGQVTTELISLAISLCPITATPTPTAYTTSTVYKTSIYTVTSCAPTVIDCPARIGQLTTELVSLYTTVCPATAEEETSTMYSTETLYSTRTYTIAKCAEGVYNCPYGKTTSEILPLSTSVRTITYVGATSTKEGVVAYSTAYSTAIGSTSTKAGAVVYSTASVASSLIKVEKATSTAAGVTYKPTASIVPSVLEFTGGAGRQSVGYGMVMVIGIALLIL